MSEALRIGGWFDVSCRIGGQSAWKGRLKNGLTLEALERTLTQLQDGQAALNWGFGLIDNDGFSALDFEDTLSSHSGWTEFTSYTVTGGSSTLRSQWTPTHPVENQVITSDSVQNFILSRDAVIAGIFLCASITKASTSGTLWATATFDRPRFMPVGSEITPGYTCSIEAG